MRRGTLTSPPSKPVTAWQQRKVRFEQACRRCGDPIAQHSLAWSRKIRGAWQYQHLSCPTSSTG